MDECGPTIKAKPRSRRVPRPESILLFGRRQPARAVCRAWIIDRCRAQRSRYIYLPIIINNQTKRGAPGPSYKGPDYTRDEKRPRANTAAGPSIIIGCLPFHPSVQLYAVTSGTLVCICRAANKINKQVSVNNNWRDFFLQVFKE